MKLRSKITAVMTPLLILFIIVINLVFGLFFVNYLHKQEDISIDTVKESVVAYLEEREIKYIGSVNDWAHWDDTYAYINGEYPYYTTENMVPEDFQNLDISFVIFTSKDGMVFDQFYYDAGTNRLTDFPAAFFDRWDSLESVINENKDLGGVFQLGEDFYFLAATNITDSNLEKDTGGHMVFGRIIDESVAAAIEQTTGCRLLSLDIVEEPKATNASSAVILENITRDQEINTIDLLIANQYAAPVKLTLAQDRDLYLNGMKNISNFALANISVLIILALILFFLLGNYFSKPFNALIKDVKMIDLKDAEIKKLPETGDKNEFSYLRRTINDMLDEIEMEQIKVRDNKEKLYATLLSVGDGVISVDRERNIQFMNPVAERLTGWKEKNALSKPIDTVFRIINEFTRETVESPVDMVFETETIIQLSNHTLLIAKNGTEKAIEDTAAPIRNKYNEVVGCVLVFRDFSERKEKQKRIEYLSYHDQLTGLYNRRFFEEELKRLDTKRNLPLSFAYADVNGLKIFNDAFGHHIGDELIQEVADVFMKECRADDIIARTGGDEFIIMLPKTNWEDAHKLIERLKESIAAKRIMDINISVSFGWDTKTQAEQSAWAVLKNAENTMYEKKIYDSSKTRHAVIRSILKILYMKSPDEETHAHRVSQLCEAIGEAYGLSLNKIKELKTAGELHDIGKIAVDKTVLNKKGTLNPGEDAQLKNHPETGFRILGTSSEYYSIAEYVLAHHENWNGKGYPKGIKGKNIPLQSRVIKVADTYDKLVYKMLYSKEAAAKEIKKQSGLQLDPQISRVLVEKVLGIPWEAC